MRYLKMKFENVFQHHTYMQNKNIFLQKRNLRMYFNITHAKQECISTAMKQKWVTYMVNFNQHYFI